MGTTRVIQRLRLTPLMQRIYEGAITSVGKLSKADLDERDSNGDSALMWAIKQKNWAIAKELVLQGANLQALNKYNETPLILLARGGLDSTQICRELEASGKMSEKDLEEARERDRLITTIKEAGHILGLKARISDIDPEGLTSKKGTRLLQEYLHKSLPVSDSHPLDHYDIADIKRAFDAAIFPKNTLVETYRATILRRYQDKQCTILPIGWDSPKGGHNIALIAWNDILVVCNRGAEKFADGISVFKMKESSTLTEQWLKQVLPDDMSPSPEEVLSGIRSLIGYEQPILTFPSLDHAYGTCTFVNLKSSLQAILCFLKLLKDDHNKAQANFSYKFLEPYLLKDTKQLHEVMTESRKKYKAVTKKMRDEFVEKLCSEFKSPYISKKTKEHYLEIFKAILSEHQGQKYNRRSRERSQEKREQEMARAKSILSAMTPEEQEQVLKGTTGSEVDELWKMRETLIQEGADMNASWREALAVWEETPLASAVLDENEE